MKVTVCRPLELGDAELDRWRQFQGGAPALRHPFLSGEFAHALSEVSERTRVAVVEDGAKIVGFLAYDRGALGVAKPLGVRLAYRQGFVHEDGLSWSWPELLRSIGLRVVEFSDLIGEQAAGQDELDVVESPIIDTSSGWDGYLEEARRRRRIKNTLYLARRLERELGPVEFTWGPIRTREFDQLIAWKSEQYRRSGWPDPFSRRWVRELSPGRRAAT
jgi:CelD/BcsL family acetyltransferase involved in cellulose biosynthesis